MSYIIRPWVTRDLKDIMHLIRESAAFHKALDQVTTTPEILRDDGFGKEATFGCLVAEVPPERTSKNGHTIVGYQFHYLSYCTWDGPILFGEDLYVVPEFRGKGIGTSLMNKVAKIALEKGCSQFRFISAQWNQPAMDFFTRLGAVNVTTQDHWHLCHIDGEHVRKLAEQSRK
ncbi:thialysine N-epsilon-acetyltransferase-like [Rhineura floridana]|uniref:thialysine N-epsilon-acetyltransferase-like n=1 Tax=Rhineura floridana TaxID=261503 RepID=UPI002AC88849|nr:thialysine N-epsilon-acetyltransferase-like [Rhineura floridana]